MKRERRSANLTGLLFLIGCAILFLAYIFTGSNARIYVGIALFIFACLCIVSIIVSKIRSSNTD